MNLLLGVCGSIGAYKAPELLRLFQREGQEVSVILTEGALHFVQPMTFAGLSPGRVHSRMMDPAEDPLLHIHLGRDHDLLLVAPASANTLARMAHGMADDLLCATWLAFTGPVVVAPAMNVHMYAHPAVQANLRLLRTWGVGVVEPGEGTLACGTVGRGRLADLEEIRNAVLRLAHGR